MRVSATVVLRAVMPTSSTATEAASEIATIFTWVVRSAPTIVELLITAIFRGALPRMSCYSCSVASGRLGSNALNAGSLLLDCFVSVPRQLRGRSVSPYCMFIGAMLTHGLGD